MGRYYNKTRSPIATTLRDGTSGYFPPKKWVTLTQEQEGVSALVQFVKKGILARREDKVEKTPLSLFEPPVVIDPSTSVVDFTPKLAPEPEIDVHVDVPIVPVQASEDADRTSPSDEVSENTIASEGQVDTESKTTKRFKSRRRG